MNLSSWYKVEYFPFITLLRISNTSSNIACSQRRDSDKTVSFQQGDSDWDATRMLPECDVDTTVIRLSCFHLAFIWR